MKDSEYSEVTKLTADQIAGKAKHLLGEINAIDPNDVLCMMGLIVHKKGGVQLATTDEEGHVKLHAFMMGDDEDIAKMFTTLVTIAKQGLMQANSPEDTTDKVKH